MAKNQTMASKSKASESKASTGKAAATEAREQRNTADFRETENLDEGMVPKGEDHETSVSDAASTQARPTSERMIPSHPEDSQRFGVKNEAPEEEELDTTGKLRLLVARSQSRGLGIEPGEVARIIGGDEGTEVEGGYEDLSTLVSRAHSQRKLLEPGEVLQFTSLGDPKSTIVNVDPEETERERKAAEEAQERKQK